MKGLRGLFQHTDPTWIAVGAIALLAVFFGALIFACWSMLREKASKEE